MPRRLILHIGTHKTGSSALQQHLGWHRRRLAARGVAYPRPRDARNGANNHRDLVQALDAGDAALEAALAHYAAALAGAEVAVLSAEGFSAGKRDPARLAGALAPGAEVRVVCFLRRADFFAESLYRHHIRQQRPQRDAFPAYAARKLERVLTRRAAVLRRWAEAFGPAAVTVIPYEPAVPGFDVVGRFLTAAGLEGAAAGLSRPPLPAANPSLSRSQAELLRRLNLEGHRLGPLRMAALRRMARDGGAYLGRAHRAAFVAAAEADTEAIRAAFVRDGRARMFPSAPERVPDMDADWPGLDPADEQRMRRRLLLPGPLPG